MKLDPRYRNERLGEQLPGHQGYGTVRRNESDLLLRRHLVNEIASVRDRLADFIAGRQPGGELHGKLAAALKAIAFLKEEIAAADDISDDGRELSPEREEGLLDYDLVLLEKVAGLQTPVDAMERARTPEEIEAALAFLEDGVAEAGELFRQRRTLLKG